VTTTYLMLDRKPRKFTVGESLCAEVTGTYFTNKNQSRFLL
jgi:hypothetical protein